MKNLIELQINQAKEQVGKQVMFHFAVKVRSDDRNQIFSFTNEQLDIARQFKKRRSNVRIIATIYALPSAP